MIDTHDMANVGSPAFEAGLRQNDLVLAFGTAHALNSPEMAAAIVAVARNSHGKPIPVIVRRGSGGRHFTHS